MSSVNTVSEFMRNSSLQSRYFRLYSAAWLLSNIGAQMPSVAVGWQVYATTHRALDLGWVGLVQFAPSLVLTLPAGDLADRIDRSRIVTACNFAFALCAAALAAGAPLFPVLFVVGITKAFLAPAGEALVPGLVPPEHLQNALTWTSTIWQIATLVGPALGGWLFVAGAEAVFVACAAVFAVAAALAFFLHARNIPPEHQGSGWSRALAGMRFVRSRPVLLQSIALDLFAVLLGGATALLPIFASDILHVGPLGLGLLRSAPALGAAAMAFWLTAHPISRRAGPLLLACVALFGVATLTFGLSRSFALSLVALVVLGATDMVSVVIRSTVVQLRTPHDMRGRVSAISMLFIATSADLGELESGVTAAWLGAVPAVIVGGLGTLAVVAVFALALTALRSVDSLEDT